eukprot:TRINITY_DN9906_c0_g1_i1.p1 TRINITY_DN9906_c0_g1~~TRINITY_DN9906_c0_g1_i1.p1  ORF type:complete len:199 (-),score=41.83 TRINITY_DN9906_c0_g1_i1:20-580(-)
MAENDIELPFALHKNYLVGSHQLAVLQIVRGFSDELVDICRFLVQLCDPKKTDSTIEEDLAPLIFNRKKIEYFNHHMNIMQHETDDEASLISGVKNLVQLIADADKRLRCLGGYSWSYLQYDIVRIHNILLQTRKCVSATRVLLDKETKVLLYSCIFNLMDQLQSAENTLKTLNRWLDDPDLQPPQ